MPSPGEATSGVSSSGFCNTGVTDIWERVQYWPTKVHFSYKERLRELGEEKA